jgi:hypothetical protein
MAVVSRMSPEQRRYVLRKVASNNGHHLTRFSHDAAHCRGCGRRITVYSNGYPRSWLRSPCPAAL